MAITYISDKLVAFITKEFSDLAEKLSNELGVDVKITPTKATADYSTWEVVTSFIDPETEIPQRPEIVAFYTYAGAHGFSKEDLFRPVTIGTTVYQIIGWRGDSSGRVEVKRPKSTNVLTYSPEAVLRRLNESTVR